MVSSENGRVVLTARSSAHPPSTPLSPRSSSSSSSSVSRSLPLDFEAIPLDFEAREADPSQLVQTFMRVEPDTHWQVVLPVCSTFAAETWGSTAEQRSAWAANKTPGEGAKRTKQLRNLSAVEVVNGISPACPPVHQQLEVMAFNAERGKYWLTLAHMIRGRAKLPDVLILNEMDIGMARSQNTHTACLLAHALEMNYAWGLEFMELSRGNQAEQEATANQQNELGLHGNAILSRCRLIPGSGSILRDTLDNAYFTEKPSFTNAYGYEVRLGGRMAMLVDVNVSKARLKVGSIHKLGGATNLARLRQVTSPGCSLIAGDETARQCASMALPPVDTKGLPTVPVVPPCTFHQSRKHQGDNICTKLPASSFQVHMPCSGNLRVSSHALITATINVSRSAGCYV